VKNTAIEWADHTFNPWIGCTKVSPACDHCYAEVLMDKRMHVAQWGAGKPRHRTTASNWAQPVKWNAEAAAAGKRARVFCASLADVFDNEAPERWRVELFHLIDRTPHLDWLLLTKRIGNARAMLDDVTMRLALRETGAPWPPRPNVWIGATICNQAEADRDIPKLIATPAHRRFLSIEPMLGPIDLAWAFADIRTACCHRCGFRTNQAGGTCPNDGETLRGDVGIDWVIVGGESGPNARPMHPEWAASLRDQCNWAGVPYLFKQWGQWMPDSAMTLADRMRDTGAHESRYVKLDGTTHWIDEDDAGRFDASDSQMVKVGKKAAGRMLDGRTWDEVPG
jgi:protein gp37